MQRYFSSVKEDDSFILSDDDSYHIKVVMRMMKSAEIEVVYNSELFICEIVSFDPVKAHIKIKKDEYNEMRQKVIVVQSLVNENKMDIILQKCTELGAFYFYGYSACNSVIKENGKSDKKILRWQKIVKEAAEQSKRNYIPKVCNIVDLKELISLKADLKIILSVNEQTKSVKKILQDNRDCDTMIIVVGPEGGFSLQEEKTLLENGFISASLGPRVLRTETASIAFLSMVNYEWMV